MHGAIGMQISGTGDKLVYKETSTVFEGRVQQSWLHVYVPGVFGVYW